MFLFVEGSNFLNKLSIKITRILKSKLSLHVRDPDVVQKLHEKRAG